MRSHFFFQQIADQDKRRTDFAINIHWEEDMMSGCKAPYCGAGESRPNIRRWVGCNFWRTSAAAAAAAAAATAAAAAAAYLKETPANSRQKLELV